MISAAQIRAARSLLNWSQQKMAKAAGLSARTLSQLEMGQIEGRHSTLTAIAEALTAAGIELLEGSGVRLAGDRLSAHRYEGEACIDLYLRDILRELPNGGEVLISGIEEKFLELADARAAAEYFKTSKERGIKERILVPEDSDFFYSHSNLSYRTLPRAIMGEVPHAIYGNTFATWIWGPPMQIVLLRNKAVAESFRRQFEVQWKMGKTKRVT